MSELFSLEADDLCLLATKTQEKSGAYAKRGIDVGLIGFELPEGAEASPRLVEAHEVLMRALDRVSTWRVEDVLRAVLVESGWVARTTAAGPDGQARLANALSAVSYASSLIDEGGLGPSQASVEFDRWLDLSKIGPASLSGGESGAVQVMTIHASKGLEFPLVAISECWGNGQASSAVGVTCENRGGVVYATLVPPDTEAKTLAKDVPDEVNDRSDLVNWARFLVNASREGDQQEMARLLYVAITRARESVILGLTVQVSAKGEYSPRLAAEVVGTLFGGALPSPGESQLDYGGSQPARVRHVVASKDEDGALTLEPETFSSLVESLDVAEELASFDLYEVRPEEGLIAPLRDATLRGARPGVFSYSSAHAQMAASFIPQEQAEADPPIDEETVVVPARMPSLVVEEEDIDAPDQTADGDKATNLGSAFHELAQTMIEAKGNHSPRRLEALCRYWHLSAAQRRRLVEAIERWERSDVRREALAWGTVRPEVPFFIKVDSAYGTHVEGAIDLLCTNPGSSGALVLDYKTGDVGLTLDQIRARHEMQANFYAHVMMTQGYDRVTCVFVCVECDRGDGQPVDVRYTFDGGNLPRI